MSVLGYKPGVNAAGYEIVTIADILNQRASVSAKMTEDGWAYQETIRGGRRTATIPRAALAIWAVGTGTAPDELVARTAEFTTGTYMLDATDGTTYTRPLQTAAMLRNGKRYGLGFVASDAPFGYGYLPKAQIVSGEQYDEFRRTVPSGPTPQDPFGTTSTNSELGWIAVWIDYSVNVPPDVPTSTTPSNGASVATLTPTFAGNFRDDNEVLPNGLAGDALGMVQIQVADDVSGLNLIWSTTYTASDTERLNRRFEAVYAGATLSNDIPYYWRCRVADRFGAWGPWSNTVNIGQAWDTFTVGSGYIVTTSGTPTGKQETQSPGPFTGAWQHSGGLNATQLALRIVDESSGVVVRETGYAALGGAGVAPGGTLSKAFGSLTPLEWGGRYAYQLRAKDAASVETNWSSPRSFHINAVPTIPIVVSPLNGGVSSTRPELIVQSTDADPDDLPGAGHVVSARIKDSGGTVLFTRTMTYDAPTQTFRYQTTSTDLASSGTYRFDFYAYDGTVYSSGNTVLGAGALSTEITFTYSSGPVITHTSPVNNATVATNIPWYNWSVTDQVRKRIRVFDADTDVMVYDSGEVTNSDTSFRQPAGYIENGGTYYRIIDVWNSSNQQGTSSPAFFTVDYTDASTLANFVASGHRARHDVTPTAVLLSWDKTEYTAGQFQSYVIARRASEDTEFDVDDEIQAENRRIAVITNPSQTTFVDYLPASGVSYIYGVKQIVEVDDVTVTSPYVHAEIMVTFQDTVICDARRGGARRFVLQAREDRGTEYEIEQVFKQPWGTAAPIEFRTNTFGRVIDGTFYIVADTPADAETMIREIAKVHYYGGPLCYRDGRGAKVFGSLYKVRRIDPPGGRVQRVELGFRQTNAYEVVAT